MRLGEPCQAVIRAWLTVQLSEKLERIPFHIMELMRHLSESGALNDGPVSTRAVIYIVRMAGWRAWNTRRDCEQCYLYVPPGWHEERQLAKARAKAREQRPAKPPIPPQWATIASGLVRGARVVVRGREEARTLLWALKAKGERGEIYKWKDGRCVVTHVGVPPILLDVCRCCRMGQCQDCQRGYVRSLSKSPVRCECAHEEFIEHVGPNSGTARLMRTRDKGSPVPAARPPRPPKPVAEKKPRRYGVPPGVTGWQ